LGHEQEIRGLRDAVNLKTMRQTIKAKDLKEDGVERKRD